MLTDHVLILAVLVVLMLLLFADRILVPLVVLLQVLDWGPQVSVV